jgi:hypothetical protein
MEDRTTKRLEIIEVAKKLFYENGLNATSLEKIAQRCNITKPLITYHFGTKAKLAGVIFGKYSADIMNYLTEKAYLNFPEYNFMCVNTANLMLNLKLYKEDEKAFRFYKEFFDSSFEDVTEGIEQFYKMIIRQRRMKIDDATKKLIYFSLNYAARGLIYHYFTGKIDCSFEQFQDYLIRMSYQALFIDNEEIDELIEKGNELLEKLDLKIYPYFRVV